MMLTSRGEADAPGTIGGVGGGGPASQAADDDHDRAATIAGEPPARTNGPGDARPSGDHGAKSMTRRRGTTPGQP